MSESEADGTTISEGLNQCCYEARLVASASGHNPQRVSKAMARALKFLKWFPFKVAITAQYVEVKNVASGAVATYGFIGLGLGAGVSLTFDLKHWSPRVCCNPPCPNFNDFAGFGRLTILEAAVGVGGNVAFIDFGTEKGCRLYFENAISVVAGLGVDIGTYLGYYVRIK